METTYLKINPADNVAVAISPLKAGETIQVDGKDITLKTDIPAGHKVTLKDLNEGENIIKYGYPIGHAKEDIPAGGWVHTHNLKTNLNQKLDYTYTPAHPAPRREEPQHFLGYRRRDGGVGVRNEIWIISTVGCVNNTVRLLEQIGQKKFTDGIDGVFGYTHLYGCSQMGDDQENTRNMIASLVNHPNAGGVLVVSLGCENTNVDVIKSYLGEIDENRVKFLVTQDCADELAEGEKLLSQLYAYVRKAKRVPVPISKLTVGFKCGGSDAFSGITANALCGRITDKLTDAGASVILTEVPEMFGAEHLLMKRAENKDIFDKIVGMINGYKTYFAEHNQVCYENPSPGNHDGGITTLEEKSLGCIQKGGSSVVTGVLGYGEKCTHSGLHLLTGPGNDIVSVTNLTASGAQIILFTTGRGTPLGAPSPTVKISSNTGLAKRKSGWIDFNAGELINGADADALADELLDFILSIASGKKTKNEINGYREISIFKDGVIM